MAPCRVRRPLLVALLALGALAPTVGQPLPASAASLAFTVTTTADSHDATPGDGVCADAASQCSLRAAVEEADAQPAGSVITITIPAGTYLLNFGSVSLTHNTITLAGAGATTIILDGQGHQVLTVAATAFAKIGGLTLHNGNAGSGSGGALSNRGLVIVSRSAIVSDSAGNGGGIFSKPTDLSNTNPLLGSLANNDGPTPTMALLPGNPAIDHGGTSANGCPAADQPGVTRPQGSACDIGAFEATP